MMGVKKLSLTKVTYSCGHDGFVELSENARKRENQINFYLTKGSCPDCYAEIVAERDKTNGIGCSKIKMTDQKYKSEYSGCKFTKVGIDEDGFRFAFVPYKQVAAEGVLKVLGVKKSNPLYSQYYETAINDYLNRNTSKARKELLFNEEISDERKERLCRAFEIIEKYQEVVS